MHGVRVCACVCVCVCVYVHMVPVHVCVVYLPVTCGVLQFWQDDCEACLNTRDAGHIRTYVATHTVHSYVFVECPLHHDEATSDWVASSH